MPACSLCREGCDRKADMRCKRPWYGVVSCCNARLHLAMQVTSLCEGPFGPMSHLGWCHAIGTLPSRHAGQPTMAGRLAGACGALLGSGAPFGATMLQLTCVGQRGATIPGTCGKLGDKEMINARMATHSVGVCDLLASSTVPKGSYSLAT